MNFRRLVSAVAALAVAGTMCAGLAVTASAAGTTTYTLSATNRGEVSGDTFTSASNAGNQYALATVDFSSATSSAGTITVDFDSVIASGSRWYIGIGDIVTRGTSANGSSKTTYNTDGLLMYFGTGDGTYYRVNGGTAISDAFGVTVHTTITLDKENAVYSYELTANDGETVLASASDVSTSMTDLSILEAYTWQNSASITVSNITVTTTDPIISEVSYTVNYALEDGTVISTVSSTGFPGRTAVISTDPIYTEDAKYIYVSSPEDLTIVEDGEYTVIVREAETYTVTVAASTGDSFGSYSVFEGDTCSYSYPKYLTDADNKVTASCDATTYTVTSAEITGNTDLEVAYTEYTGTAYFYEMEDIATDKTEYENSKLSNGKAVRGLSTDTSTPTYDIFTAPADGTYTIKVHNFSNNITTSTDEDGNSVVIPRYIYIYSNDTLSDTYSVTYSINYTVVNETELTLSKGDVVALVVSDSQVVVDYVLIELAPTLTTATTTTAVDGNDIPEPDGDNVYLASDTDKEKAYSYTTLKGENEVTTIYAKVENPSSSSAPTLIVDAGGENEITSTTWSQVGTSGIYFAQFIGDISKFGTIQVTYDGLSKTVETE